jgi:uncharacterized membrane protein
VALALAFLIGVLGGLRSMTAPAVVAWAAHLGWLKLGQPLAWMGTAPAVGIFTLLALAELVVDKLPSTPSRTAPPGLVARVIVGALTGASLALAGGVMLAIGAALGAVGGIAGAFGGYQLRTRLVKALGAPDFAVALLEDIVAVGGSIFAASRF